MNISISMRKNGRKRVLISGSTETRTEQCHKNMCDTNTIAKRLQRGEYYDPGQGVYGDFTSGLDFQMCMDRIVDAQQDFDRLPAQLRKRFNNSPADLLNFLCDPENRDEGIKLGLINPVALEPDPPAEPATEATPPPTE